MFMAAAMARSCAGVDARELGDLAAGARDDAQIVLPFQGLRADPDIDFLSFSLADAITTSLSGLESLVVRSTDAGARFAAGPPDLRAIAAETNVDIVLVGTLLRAADRLRVTTQLLEAPDGTVIWSHTAQVLFGDIFQLQDDLAGRIVSSLSLPLTAPEHRVWKHDVPASAKAYEFYLRANLVASDTETWTVARDLYLQCVVEDPQYAPAWARLGRIYRVLAKYGRADEDENLKRAQSAFACARAQPGSRIAHDLYVYLESTSGGRGRDASPRRLGPAAQRRSGAVRRPRSRVPVLRPARRLDRRLRTGHSPRSEDLNERGAHVFHAR